MSNETYRFKVGKFECIAVSDGTYTYAPPNFPPPGTFLFVNAMSEALERALREYNLSPGEWEEWTSPYICLVVNTGKHRVLVDTGADGLAPSTGRLLQNLKAEQIAPEDINTVIITHGHPDHIGGNTDAEGRPAFPNARYVMWRDEWDFWTSGRAEQALDEHSRETLMKFARRNLPSVQGQLDLIDHETEIMSGISAIAAPGHTPGHMALAISSEDEELLYVSDAFLHPIHIRHPEWYAAIDIVPEQAGATRHQLLKKASTEKALVLAFHFPFPGLGCVVWERSVWNWLPVGA